MILDNKFMSFVKTLLVGRHFGFTWMQNAAESANNEMDYTKAVYSQLPCLTSYLPRLFKKDMLTEPEFFFKNHLPEPRQFEWKI